MAVLRPNSPKRRRRSPRASIPKSTARPPRPPLRIDISLDDRRLRRALAETAEAGRDLAPAMRSIGELLLNSTRGRFGTQRSPDGVPWAPLSDTTRRRKRRNADKILTERGHLRGTIAYRAGRDFVEVGSSRVYASTHQFGAKKGEFGGVRTSLPGRSFFQPIPWGDIPARPFLGLSDEDETAISQELLDYITAPWA